MPEKEATRKKILDVTKRLMRTEGIGNLTVRRIAKEANVNVASINYHFGSKDDLFFLCIREVVIQLEKALLIFENKRIPVIERVKGYLSELAKILIENPEVPDSFLRTLATDRNLPTGLRDFISCFYLSFRKFLVENTTVEDEETATMILEQMISAIWFPVFSYKTTSKITGIDFRRKRDREKYVDFLVDNSLGRYI